MLICWLGMQAHRNKVELQRNTKALKSLVQYFMTNLERQFPTERRDRRNTPGRSGLGTRCSMMCGIYESACDICYVGGQELDAQAGLRMRRSSKYDHIIT